MSMTEGIRNVLRFFGYDICRFLPTFQLLGRIKKIFESYDIDTVLDVGANSGQFAQQLREIVGYKKKLYRLSP